MNIEISPNQDESYKGRQWGYTIHIEGLPYLRCWTGGTGPCWNLLRSDGYEADETMHVCDLDSLIAALTALRDSNAYKQNVARWA